jgi:hypothetical protein
MSKNSRMIFPCVMNCKRPVLGCTRVPPTHEAKTRDSQEIQAYWCYLRESSGVPKKGVDGTAAQAPVSELGNVWANHGHGGVRMQIHARTSP